MKRFARDRSGATAVEYGIMAAMLAIVVIACISALTPNVGSLLSGVAAAFPTIG